MSRADSTGRTVARWALGGVLLVAGIGHLTTQREEFQAQVPDWVPVDDDVVVVASGVVEMALGASLILLRRQRVAVGLVVAGFFIAVFPGNIGQWREGTDAFGLDSDTEALRAAAVPAAPRGVGAVVDGRGRGCSPRRPTT